MTSSNRRRRTEPAAAGTLFGDQESDPATTAEPAAAPAQAPAAAPASELEALASTIEKLDSASTSAVRKRRAAKTVAAPRQLPFSKQFSPRQIPSLGAFLKAIDDSAGTSDQVRDAAFALLHPGVPHTNRTIVTMAYNAVLSARHYGLVSATMDGLTALGKALLALPDDEARVLALARHILHSLNGIELVAGIAKLARAGRHLTKVPLVDYFNQGGLGSNRDGTDINALAGWLRAAGIYEPGGWYRLNEKTFFDIAQIGLDTTEALARLSAENRAVLEQLALMPGHKSDSGEMQRLLRGRADLHIDGPAFVTKHLAPLRAAGLVETVKTTTGRGGNYTEFHGTALFDDQVVQDLVDRMQRQGFPVSGPELERPFSELIAEMRDASASKDTRGRALELFALRMLQFLGLRHIGFRVRPTLSEEIDGWAEGFAPIHTRWQVQCKNTLSFSVHQAAKEVGVAVRQRATVVLLVTTGDFSDDAIDYIQEVIRNNAVTIVRINGRDVTELSSDESKLWDILAREAQRAYALRSGIVESLLPTLAAEPDEDEAMVEEAPAEPPLGAP